MNIREFAAEYEKQMANLRAVWQPIFKDDTDELLRLISEASKTYPYETLDAVADIATSLMRHYTAATKVDQSPINMLAWLKTLEYRPIEQ